MVISHNLVAMNAQRQFNIVGNSQKKSVEKLSSGYKINRAADDAAGLAISEKMRRQIRGLDQGARNISDGIGFVQVGDGALAEVDDMLHRLTELSVKSANGTLTNEDRSAIQQEVNQIVAEIDRIGKTTTFNERHLFDKEPDPLSDGKISKLVTSPSAEAGKLAEGYPVGGVYYPSASLDFSNVNSENIKRLAGGYFSFNCSASCSEAFMFTFTDDGTPSHFDPRTAGRYDTHQFYVDISNCDSGSDLVNEIYRIVSSVTPASVETKTSTVASNVGGVAVSHTNVLKVSGDKLYLIGTGSGSYPTQAGAAKMFANNPKYGKVDCSSLTKVIDDDLALKIPIQCSATVEDVEFIYSKKMNAEILGISPLNISTQTGAQNSIDRIKDALGFIADLRSDFGATQNRLEHAYNINLNSSENTQYAESAIRDTDMAKEMVDMSLLNILSQAGISMMEQANLSNQAVLSLLQ